MVGVFNSLEQAWIFENFQGEEIDISNGELEVNENFKKYNGKNLIFRKCPNLKRIEANCLNLTGLEIKNCPELKYLSAYHNEIIELDFTGCKKINTIYVPYNHRLNEKGEYEFGLETIDIKDCQELESLNVSSCEIAELDLTNNRKLEHLSCDNTFISKLNVKHLSELETLHCFKSNLEQLDCSGLKKLKDLNCAGNKNVDFTFRSKERVKLFNDLLKLDYKVRLFEGLEKLNVKGCENLEQLDCAENSLKKLDLSNLKNLNFVSTKENSLKQLNITNCPKLDFIDFSDQQDYFYCFNIRTFFKINDDNKNLRKIFCDKKTDFFDLETKKTTDWKYFPKLELLEVGESREEIINDEKGEFERFIISYFWDKIPEFEEYLAKKKQQQQEDEGYQSGEIPTDSIPPKRKKKSEYENQAWLSTWLELKALKDRAFIDNLDNYKHELKDLDLSWQNLTGKLVIGNWTNLKSLNVSNNELEHLVVKDCPNLERIIFSHNQLKKVEISGCPKLNYKYSYNSDNFVNPIEENLEDQKAQELLSQEKPTLDELLTLDFNKLSEVVCYQVIKLAEKLLSEFTYKQLEAINPHSIPKQLILTIINLLKKKFEELLSEQNQNHKDQEKQKEQENKELVSKIANLIQQAQQALKENNLSKLKIILDEIKTHCGTSAYDNNKELIAKLEQQLINATSQSEPNNKTPNLPLIIGLSLVSIGILVLLLKFLQNKLKKMLKFR